MGKKKKSGQKKKAAKNQQTAKYSADDLIDKIEEYLDCFEFDLAVKFCEKAISIAPENLKVIETAGSVYAEIGDLEKSKECFTKAVELNPDKGHEKYMYLGQISSGDEAKKWYLKGVEIMKGVMGTEDAENVASADTNKSLPTGTDISNAYCALAEIFMTDSCFDDDAEKECEKYCKEAISWDSTNIDGYIVNANFLLSQEKREEAANILRESFELLNLKIADDDDKESVENGMNEDGENGMEEEKGGNPEAEEGIEDEVGDSNIPSYTSRVSLSKLLTEVGEYKKAETLMNRLIEENDEDLEVWYMLGWNMFLQDQFEDSMFLLMKAKELYERMECEDEELLGHLNELLETCKTKTNVENNDEGMDVEE